MGLPTTELCLGSRPITIAFRTADGLAWFGDDEASAMKIEECLRCLDDERKKIEVFKRELPLCLRLVKQVIDVLKEEFMQCGGKSRNCLPVLGQFLPVKGKLEEDRGMKWEKDCRDKMNWMSTAQLWNDSSRETNNTRSIELITQSGEVSQIRSKNDVDFPTMDGVSRQQEGGKQEKNLLVTPHDLSLFPPGFYTSCGSNSKSKCLSSLFSLPNDTLNLPEQLQQQNTPRKARRCWSEELHKKFVSVLKQLGGSHVATPKQIREMMMVDGLTNDEIKSHLQKYRLHVQRQHASSSTNDQECHDAEHTNHAPLMSMSS